MKPLLSDGPTLITRNSWGFCQPEGTGSFVQGDALHVIHTNACIVKLSFTSQKIQDHCVNDLLYVEITNACIAKSPSASQGTQDHCVNGLPLR